MSLSSRLQRLHYGHGPRSLPRRSASDSRAKVSSVNLTATRSSLKRPSKGYSNTRLGVMEFVSFPHTSLTTTNHSLHRRSSSRVVTGGALQGSEHSITSLSEEESGRTRPRRMDRRFCRMDRLTRKLNRLGSLLLGHA